MARLSVPDRQFDLWLEGHPATRELVREVADDIAAQATKYAYDRIPSISIAAGIHVINGPGRSMTVRSTAPPRMPSAVPLWSHDGTGIYGPRRKRITPRRAKYLRFYWYKIDKVVYAKSVRGRRPTYYMSDAAQYVARRRRGVRYRERR